MSFSDPAYDLDLPIKDGPDSVQYAAMLNREEGTYSVVFKNPTESIWKTLVTGVNTLAIARDIAHGLDLLEERRIQLKE